MTTLTSKRLTLTADSLSKLKAPGIAPRENRLGLKFKKREVTINRNAKASRSFGSALPQRGKFDKKFKRFEDDKRGFKKKPMLTPEQKAAKKAAWLAAKAAKEAAKKEREHRKLVFNKRYRFEMVNGLKVRFPRLRFQSPKLSIIYKVTKEGFTDLTEHDKKVMYIHDHISPKLANQVKQWDMARLDLVTVYGNMAGAEAALKMFDVRRRHFYVSLRNRRIKIASINKEAIKEVKQNTQFMELLYGITKARSRVTFFPFFENEGDHAKFKKIRVRVKKGLMNYYKGERMIHNMIKATLVRRAEKREARRLKAEEEKKLKPQPKKSSKRRRRPTDKKKDTGVKRGSVRRQLVS